MQNCCNGGPDCILASVFRNTLCWLFKISFSQPDPKFRFLIFKFVYKQSFSTTSWVESNTFFTIVSYIKLYILTPLLYIFLCNALLTDPCAMSSLSIRTSYTLASADLLMQMYIDVISMFSLFSKQFN